MILKPFMLRRVKKDVENELSEKVRNKSLFKGLFLANLQYAFWIYVVSY